MLEHAKMTIGLVYELAFFEFEEKKSEDWNEL